MTADIIWFPDVLQERCQGTLKTAPVVDIGAEEFDALFASAVSVACLYCGKAHAVSGAVPDGAA